MNDMSNQTRILIVDDIQENLDLFEAVLRRNGYTTITASNGREALEKIEAEVPSLILLDIMMPEMDGFETITKLRQNHEYEKIPVIFLTSQKETHYISRAFSLGAVDYVNKPCNSSELLARVKTHLENYKMRYQLEQEVEARSQELVESYKELSEAHNEILFRLGRAAEYRDNETGAHIRRIGEYGRLVALALGVNAKLAATIANAGMMHDVGKIGIADEILLKPGKLTPEEFDEMKKHTLIGADLLKGVNSELIREAEKIALSHHEKFDGSGYPAGQKGEEIPLGGRIVAVVDVYDALTSRRPYKEPWPNEKACDLLRAESGKHFDPKVVDAFFSVYDSILEVQEKMKD